MVSHVWYVVSLQGMVDYICRMRTSFWAKNENVKNDCVLDFNKILSVPEGMDIPFLQTTELSYISYCIIHGIDIIETTMTAERKKFLFMNYLKDRNDLQYCVFDFPSYLNYCHKESKFGINLNIGKQYMENKVNYGFGTASEWCKEYWGTRGNTLNGQDMSVSKFGFSLRGNDIPNKIFEKISERYSEALITIRYAGEIAGVHSGVLQYYKGKKKLDIEYSMSAYYRYIREGRQLDKESFKKTSLEFWNTVKGCMGVPFSVEKNFVKEYLVWQEEKRLHVEKVREQKRLALLEQAKKQ